jgi:hypothetical protein
VACFKVLSRHLPGGSDEDHENFCHGNRSPDQHWNANHCHDEQLLVIISVFVQRLLCVLVQVLEVLF